MDDLLRTYEATQLDPDELAELRAQREAQAHADMVREYDRPRMRGGLTRNGPDTYAELERGRAEQARHFMIPKHVRTRSASTESAPLGAHPQSRRNGSGFTGRRLRIKVR